MPNVCSETTQDFASAIINPGNRGLKATHSPQQELDLAPLGRVAALSSDTLSQHSWRRCYVQYKCDVLLFERQKAVNREYVLVATRRISKTIRSLLLINNRLLES